MRPAPMPSIAFTASAPTEIRGHDRSTTTLDARDRALIGAWLVCAVIAVALPYPPTKVLVGILLGAVYVHASFASFHLALSGFVLLLPFLETAYKGSILFPGINLQTLFVLYISGVAASHAGRDRLDPARNPVALPLACLVALTVSSALLVGATSNADLSDLLMRIKNSFAYALLMVFGFWLVRKPNQKLMVLTCVFIAVIVNVVFSLRDVSVTQALQLSVMRHRAVSLISAQPNLYAGFLSLYLFFFAAFLMYYPAGRKVKILVLAATVLVTMNLVYTLSRGAWLACGGAAVFVAGLKSRRLAVPMAALAVFLYFWMPDVATERWDKAFEQGYDPALIAEAEGTEMDEAATRVVQWRSFLSMMGEHPVLGAGYGEFPRFFKEGGYYPVAKSAHSSIVEIGVELGPFGLVFYLWILGAAYRGGSRVFKTADLPVERVLGLGLLAATVCLFLLDFSGTRFRNGNITAYYWILAGITLNAALAGEGTRQPIRLWLGRQ